MEQAKDSLASNRGILHCSFVFAEGLAGIAVPNLETTLSAGFAISLIAFLPIASAGLGQKALRDPRRICVQKVTRCSICNEPLPEASLRQSQTIPLSSLSDCSSSCLEMESKVAHDVGSYCCSMHVAFPLRHLRSS
jgi:hypothetical protein